jgi:phage baseplate assembly protein W|tara:strand:- start:914 stop:1321 length:408 start_codon:yes stop_codon:yes gene_type:complete
MSRYTDLNLSLDKNTFTGDISVVTDANAIRNSIANILLTDPDERPFSSSQVGVGIKNLLFDVDIKSAKYAFIVQTVKEHINRYEKRVIFEEMDFVNRETTKDDGNMILEIKYTVKANKPNEQNAMDSLQITIEGQ